MARVIVVGGGIASLEAAHILKKGTDVVVFSGSDYYASGPSRPLILSGEQRLDRIVRGYHFSGLRVLPEKVIKVDPENRTVVTSEGRRESYDYLILATGLRYDYSRFQGVLNVYDMGRLYDLKNAIWTMKKGTIVVNAPKQPYRCAPAPSETILTIDMVLRHRGVRDSFQLFFVEANPKVQPPVIHDVVVERFQEAGIEYIMGKEVASVENGAVTLSDGDVIQADLSVILPPNYGSSPLGRGFLEVRSPNDLRLKEYDDVFAVGDVARLPFPKNSEVASISARIAATQILEDMGVGEKQEEQYRFVGWAYAGNLEGELKTESIRFELEFTPQGPKGSKDPEPRTEYTRQKDLWEQAVLKKLFGY